MNFIIYAPPANHPECSGGQIALRQLVKNLQSLGEDAQWTDTVSDQRDATVVYPEVVIGNPLNGKRVVRWLLNTPGVLGGDGIYDDDEFIFTFAEYFPLEGRQADGILTAFDFKLDFWEKNKNLPRIGTCYIERKGRGKEYVHGPLALRLDGYEKRGGHRLLRAAFNASKRFISYDHATMLSVFAALCGCESIVIPDENVSAKEWRHKLPYFRYGIAYGLDDLDYARKTTEKVRDNLEELERQSLEQTRQFIRITH